jgi:hypothetical protein
MSIHLTKYYRSNTSVNIARIQKVSIRPAVIKYKFGIQVPKGINNAIESDKRMEIDYGKKLLRLS